ncbi:MAG: TIGR02678 family protein [Ruminococcus sp.]|nr:TIGR02678 family protein [Ruminococcus sp.]
MEEFTELLDSFWIVRDNDSSDYYKVKRSIDSNMKKFLTEFVGWKLFVNNKLIKLEKLPAEAHPFMGIQRFDSINEYMLLCALLIYLDDKMDGTHFLLSELIESIEKIIDGYADIDLTRFADRKSLVKVLKFAEEMSMLRISDGSIEAVERNQSKEILYENMGLSKYFSVNHDSVISDYTDYRDFESRDTLYTDDETGMARTHRVYRGLLLQPAMYWDSNDDMDSIYLKNQRQSVYRYLDKYVGGRLDIHNGAAFLMVSEDEVFGSVHPSDKSISGFIALMCSKVREKYSFGGYSKMIMSAAELDIFILECKEYFFKGLSKELREMTDERFTSLVKKNMADWQLIEPCEDGYYLRDGVYKTAGRYPKDYKEE